MYGCLQHGQCRDGTGAGLVDRFRVASSPCCWKARKGTVYDDYHDVAFDMIGSWTFDFRIQVVEYRPRVLEGPPSLQARDPPVQSTMTPGLSHPLRPGTEFFS